MCTGMSFHFPYCYYTRGLSAFDTLSLVAQFLEGFLFSLLKKKICVPYLILVLFCFEPVPSLIFLAPKQQPES